MLPTSIFSNRNILILGMHIIYELNIHEDTSDSSTLLQPLKSFKVVLSEIYNVEGTVLQEVSVQNLEPYELFKPIDKEQTIAVGRSGFVVQISYLT